MPKRDERSRACDHCLRLGISCEGPEGASCRACTVKSLPCTVSHSAAPAQPRHRGGRKCVDCQAPLKTGAPPHRQAQQKALSSLSASVSSSVFDWAMASMAVEESFIFLPNESTATSVSSLPPSFLMQSWAGQPQSHSQAQARAARAQAEQQSLANEEHAELMILEEIDAIATRRAKVPQSCPYCISQIIESLEGQLTEAEEAYREYSATTEQMQSESDPDASATAAEIAEERQLQQQLEALEHSVAELRGREVELLQANRHFEQEDRLLSLEEQKLLKSHLAGKWREEQCIEVRDEHLRKSAAVAEYLPSEHTNAVQFAFDIDTLQMPAVINGFRLGCPSEVGDEPVEWEEINAALGDVALLVKTLARCFGMTFPRSQVAILPMGSLSRVYSYHYGTNLNLYGSANDRNSHSSFNRGLQALLAAQGELFTQITLQHPECPAAPFPIASNRVDGDSIVRLCDDDKVWTRALHKMLTNLEWAISCVSSTTSKSIQHK